jgi:hypothetical protein
MLLQPLNDLESVKVTPILAGKSIVVVSKALPIVDYNDGSVAMTTSD